jgi:hypothetical protein
MSTPAQMESHAGRVFNILESINSALGKSSAMPLIESAHRSPVPVGLSRTHSRFSLRFMSETAKPWHAGLTPEEKARRESKVAAGRGKVAQQKAKAAERYQAGKADKPKGPSKPASLFKKQIEYDREKIGMSPDEMKALAKKDAEEKKPKKPAAAPKPPRDDDAPPPPPEAPAAGAQALDDDPVAKKIKAKMKGGSSIPDDDEVANRIKGQLTKRKSRAKPPEDPEDVYKSKAGRQLAPAAALQRMAKRKREGKVGTGDPETSKADGIHDKLAALRDLVGNITDHVRQGRAASTGRAASGLSKSDKTQNKPFVSPSRRWTTRQHPEDDTSPEDFERHQADRTQDLDHLERERQRRGRGRSERGKVDHAPRSAKAKASKLYRMQKTHPATRDREQDTAKGYSTKEHPKWQGHHVDPKTGENVHSSGKKKNKEFANATTFGNSDDDAMLHTDKAKGGSRGSAGDGEFAFVGDTDKDPRQKWYRVSKEGGYASAMASLGKSYHKDGDEREQVIDKVKGTGFSDAKGHQIDVRPTGALHDERPKCAKDKDGNLNSGGEALKRRDPQEFYRLCKGTHDGPGGTVKGRSEYETGFGPEHDDRSKVDNLHKAAEAGKKALAGSHKNLGPTGRQAARDDAAAAR